MSESIGLILPEISTKYCPQYCSDIAVLSVTECRIRQIIAQTVCYNYKACQVLAVLANHTSTQLVAV